MQTNLTYKLTNPEASNLNVTERHEYNGSPKTDLSLDTSKYNMSQASSPEQPFQNKPGFTLGCARLGSVQNPMNAQQCISLIQAAYDLGVREFDTASVYGQGDSERYIGKALKSVRGNVLISSKAGLKLSAKQAFLANFKAPIRFLLRKAKSAKNAVANQRDMGVPRCFDPEYIERSLHQSLKRLQTDYLDIFYLHSPEPTVMQDPALRAKLKSLKAAGRFKLLGISCDDDETALAAAKDADIDVVQFGMTPTPACQEILDTVARTGKVAHVRGLMQEHAQATRQHADLVDRIRASVAHPAVKSIIMGTTKLNHLQQNFNAFVQATSQDQVN